LVLLAVSEWLVFSAILTKSEIPGSDFVTVYTGAKLVGTNPMSLYDLKAQYKIEREVVRSEGWKQIFLYPPFFALAIRPLGHMSYAAAYWTWIGLTVLLYSASVLLLIYESRRDRGTLLLTAIAAPAFYWLILSGQTTAIALFIFVSIYVALTRQSHFIAGVLMALLAYRPQFMILLVPICMVKLPRSAFTGFFAMLFVLFVTGAVGLSVDSYARYYALLRETTDLLRFGLFPLGFFISSYGFLRGLGSETFASLGCVGLVILFGYWLFVRWPNENDPEHVAKWFASLIVATLLTMSYSLIYDLLLIILVVALAPAPRQRGAQAIPLAFLYCAPIVYFFVGDGTINLSPIALGWLFLAIYQGCQDGYGTIVGLKVQQNIASG
jgi:hypothetical protein